MPSQTGELLAIQGRAIASHQSAEAGINPRAMRTRMGNGRWQRLQWGVYAAYSGEPARETMLWAALLRAGSGAVLSHQTAAERHGLIDGASSLITITVPAARHPAQVKKIPGVVIHRSDAILRTTHPAMLPPCTRVEDTVLDLIQIAPTFDDAFAWICRAIGRRLTTADRIRQSMGARKKTRWRKELTLALGDAGDGVLSLLEYRYVRRVERPHGLPAARRQARIRQRTGNRYLDNLYEAYGVARSSTGPRRIRPTSSGETSAGTTPMRPRASLRSGSDLTTWVIVDAIPQPPLPQYCTYAAGRTSPIPAPALDALSLR
jgi:hypothetical protein